MAIPFLNNVDLNQNQVLNMRLHQLGSAPSGVSGQVYYNTGNNRPAWHDGSTWQDIWPVTNVNTANTAVRRDASGNFSAGTITATLSGNASTATALATARAFSITGKATASGINFDGTGAVALSVTALSVVPGDITLAAGSFIVGSGGVGAATAKSAIPLSGFGAAAADVDMGGFKLTQVATPTNANDAANKLYVDTAVQGLDPKESARLATAAALPAYTGTGTLTASANAALVIDGVNAAVGDRILVKNEATGARNGLYVVTSPGSGVAPWVITRTADANVSADVTNGLYVFVTGGSTQAATGWVLTTADPITLDTTALTFTQFAGAGSTTQGNGIVVSGTTVHFATSSGYTANTIPFANSGTGITFTSAPSSGQLLIGNGSGVPTFTTLSGDATLAGTGALTINANAITYAKFQQVPVRSLVGNPTSTLANASSIQASAANQVLRSDSTNSSIGFGALDLSQVNTVGSSVLGAANGGTGQSSYAVGDILWASASTTLSKLALGAQYTFLKSTGTAPTWGAVNLGSAEVTGTLGAGNGGTGNAFTAFSGPATSVKTYTLKNQNSTLPVFFAGTITGNSATTSFTVNHGLNTRDAVVMLVQSASPFAHVMADIEMLDANNVTVRFATAPATGTNYRCIVVGH